MLSDFDLSKQSDPGGKPTIIYEMLYGTTPFKGKNRNATFANILRDEVPFPEHAGAAQISK
jgi:protein-serine/threonine kinase